MASKFANVAGTALACSMVASCGSLPMPDIPLMGSSETTPVVTEHSHALQCLGALIDGGKLPAVLIEVDEIRDRTVPERLSRPSRLSQAGEWLVVTAISKLETVRVRSALEDDAKKARSKPDFRLSGAWTQDDELLRQSAGLLDLGWLTGALNLGGDRNFDYVAGDFASVRDGVVQYSTAIGVLVGANGVDAQLLVEDGVNQARIGFKSRWADGPQMAQRRIAEAATLIHVARHYKIDFLPCLESGWADPDGFRRDMQRYTDAAEGDRHRLIKEDLRLLGYQPGSSDATWDSTAARALAAYQSDNGIPLTGKHSPAVYGIIRSDVVGGRSAR
jgi:Putative peptidoglycan binding domain